MSAGNEGLSVRFRLAQASTSRILYATGIHKSQGSEYPAVVIPLAMQQYTLLDRNLIYTAVTSGKKLVTIIGQPKALAMAVKNRKSNLRLTKLAALISESG